MNIKVSIQDKVKIPREVYCSDMQVTIVLNFTQDIFWKYFGTRSESLISSRELTLSLKLFTFFSYEFNCEE